MSEGWDDAEVAVELDEEPEKDEENELEAWGTDTDDEE